LRQVVEHTTGILGFVGFGSLICLALALPDVSIKTAPTFVAQFVLRS
jgi:hypothetical protein